MVDAGHGHRIGQPGRVVQDADADRTLETGVPAEPDGGIARPPEEVVDAVPVVDLGCEGLEVVLVRSLCGGQFALLGAPADT
jgi:hypothetical protein